MRPQTIYLFIIFFLFLLLLVFIVKIFRKIIYGIECHMPGMATSTIFRGQRHWKLRKINNTQRKYLECSTLWYSLYKVDFIVITIHSGIIFYSVGKKVETTEVSQFTEAPIDKTSLKWIGWIKNKYASLNNDLKIWFSF